MVVVVVMVEAGDGGGGCLLAMGGDTLHALVVVTLHNLRQNILGKTPPVQVTQGNHHQCM